jgi:hypothetical protein
MATGGERIANGVDRRIFRPRAGLRICHPGVRVAWLSVSRIHFEDGNDAVPLEPKNPPEHTMKNLAILAIATLSFAAAGSALAQEARFQLPQPITSDVSRAQVDAQLIKARADGTLPFGQADVMPVLRTHSDLTRAEVRAQTLKALADGQFALLNGAGSNDFSVPTPSPSAGTTVAMTN